MDLFWLYDLNTLSLFLLIVLFFIFISVAGLFIMRRRFTGITMQLHGQNEHVGFYMNVIGLFYGITLALVTVSAWENYSDTSSAVTNECACLATLYRNVSSFPDSTRKVLQKDLKDYTRHLIDTGWPLQQRGAIAAGSTMIVDRFRKDLTGFEPSTPRQEILLSQALNASDDFTKARRRRLDAVDGALPAILWWVIMLGAVITIAMTWFYHMENLRLQVIFNCIIGTLLGCMIFLLVALDNPFRGELSVTPEPFEFIYTHLMSP